MTNALIPSEISVSDLDTALDNEPRILDVRLGERLGMAQPMNIRAVIDANRVELERYGAIFAHRAKNKGRGRPATAYYLNEAQALLLCMFSRTDNAADVRQEVISVYMAYRHGQSPALPVSELAPTYCQGCAFGEFIQSSQTTVGASILSHVSADHAAELLTPPNQDEMSLITDRRRERRELIEEVRRELASRLFGSGGRGADG